MTYIDSSKWLMPEPEDFDLVFRDLKTNEMQIQGKEFYLTMSHEELWSIAWDVKNAFMSTIKDHWVNHQDSWRNNEKARLKRIESLFNALGRPDLFINIETEVKQVFEDFNKNHSQN